MIIQEDVRRIVATTEIVLYPESLTIVSIEKDEEHKARKLLKDLGAFSSITFDIAEVSLVVKTDEWFRLRNSFEKCQEEGPYRLITFDIVLDLSIVGFMAAISKRLADEGVSIFALSTYLRDHILVSETDAKKAMKSLEGLIKECKR